MNYGHGYSECTHDGTKLSQYTYMHTCIQYLPTKNQTVYILVVVDYGYGYGEDRYHAKPSVHDGLRCMYVCMYVCIGIMRNLQCILPASYACMYILYMYMCVRQQGPM